MKGTKFKRWNSRHNLPPSAVFAEFPRLPSEWCKRAGGSRNTYYGGTIPDGSACWSVTEAAKTTVRSRHNSSRRNPCDRLLQSLCDMPIILVRVDHGQGRAIPVATIRRNVLRSPVALFIFLHTAGDSVAPTHPFNVSYNGIGRRAPCVVSFTSTFPSVVPADAFGKVSLSLSFPCDKKKRSCRIWRLQNRTASVPWWKR